MIAFLLWCILFVLCWPIAILALVMYPFIWLLLLPFRIMGIAVHGVLAQFGRVNAADLAHDQADAEAEFNVPADDRRVDGLDAVPGGEELPVRLLQRVPAAEQLLAARVAGGQRGQLRAAVAGRLTRQLDRAVRHRDGGGAVGVRRLDRNHVRGW